MTDLPSREARARVLKTVKRMNSFKHLTQVFIFACAVGCASASTLVSIKGCTYTYIDPVSGSMKPASGQFIYFDLCRPFNVLANQFNKTYIAYGPIVDTMQVLEVHGWDGEWRRPNDFAFTLLQRSLQFSALTWNTLPWLASMTE